jgi:hypothetical protein
VPEQVLASPGAGLIGVVDDGAYLVSGTPDGCSQRSRCDSILQLVRGDDTRDLVRAPAIGPIYFLDDDTLVVGARIELGGAPYEDDIRRIDLAAPDDSEVLYGPGDELPSGARLHVVVGAHPAEGFLSLTDCTGACPDQRLPQPSDLGVCASDPTAPGC